MGTTSQEITRIQNARNTIRDKMVELGLSTSTAKLDALATAIDGIENKGAITASVREGDSYTIPAGYHNGSGTVTGVSGGGNYTLQTKKATPTKNQQSITPDQGYYGLSAVTVEAIPESYQNVSSVTATAADVLANKVIINSKGETVTGTMANNGAVAKTLDATTGNQSYTIPAGYHNGNGKVTVVLEEKTATPTKSAQDITPTTGKVLSKVTVAAIPDKYVDTSDANAAAANILVGKTAYVGGEKVTGTMPNNGEKYATLHDSNQMYFIPEGYHNGNGCVEILVQEKTVTPTTSSQIVTPDDEQVLSKVTVSAIPAIYGDATEANAVAANILSGKKAITKVNNAATMVEGTMADNGAITGSIDGLTTTSYTVPAGYTTGGTVSLTNDINEALAAI